MRNESKIAPPLTASMHWKLKLYFPYRLKRSFQYFKWFIAIVARSIAILSSQIVHFIAISHTKSVIVADYGNRRPLAMKCAT